VTKQNLAEVSREFIKPRTPRRAMSRASPPCKTRTPRKVSPGESAASSSAVVVEKMKTPRDTRSPAAGSGAKPPLGAVTKQTGRPEQWLASRLGKCETIVFFLFLLASLPLF
jgi:hypothetical protein